METKGTFHRNILTQYPPLDNLLRMMRYGCDKPRPRHSLIGNEHRGCNLDSCTSLVQGQTSTHHGRGTGVMNLTLGIALMVIDSHDGFTV